uniref:Uncharacterized protein n=1 Tax=Panagrolaimus sp. ES5 TaxID=591445 RepID=A0AC34FRC6_9BILA
MTKSASLDFNQEVNMALHNEDEHEITAAKSRQHRDTARTVTTASGKYTYIIKNGVTAYCQTCGNSVSATYAAVINGVLGEIPEDGHTVECSLKREDIAYKIEWKRLRDAIIAKLASNIASYQEEPESPVAQFRTFAQQFGSREFVDRIIAEIDQREKQLNKSLMKTAITESCKLSRKETRRNQNVELQINNEMINPQNELIEEQNNNAAQQHLEIENNENDENFVENEEDQDNNNDIHHQLQVELDRFLGDHSNVEQNEEEHDSLHALLPHDDGDATAAVNEIVNQVPVMILAENPEELSESDKSENKKPTLKRKIGLDGMFLPYPILQTTQ